MTAEQFVSEVEGYYGKYPADRPKARAYTMLYLKDNFTDKERLELWRRLRVEFSGRYRSVPDIADLEAVRRKMDREPDYPELQLPGPDETPSEEEREEMAVRLAELREEAQARLGEMRARD